MSELPAEINLKRISVKAILSPVNSADEMAKALFATLRQMDQHPEVALIVVDFPKGASPLISALQDRLRRASRNKP